MNALIRDLRYALRALAKNPGFSIAAILSLAIGIGANTSIFSITSALLLRPLPYKDADRLVILWNRSPGLNITQDWFSTAQYFDIKNGHSGFEDVAIAFGTNDNLTGNGDPERIGTIRISSNLLPMLGYRAAMGRLFIADEDVAGHNPNRDAQLWHVDAPLRLRPAHSRQKNRHQRQRRAKWSACCRNLFRCLAK